MNWMGFAFVLLLFILLACVYLSVSVGQSVGGPVWLVTTPTQGTDGWRMRGDHLRGGNGFRWGSLTFHLLSFQCQGGHMNGLLLDWMFNSHSKGSGFKYNVCSLPVEVHLTPTCSTFIPKTSLYISIKVSAECSMKPRPLDAYLWIYVNLWCWLASVITFWYVYWPRHRFEIDMGQIYFIGQSLIMILQLCVFVCVCRCVRVGMISAALWNRVKGDEIFVIVI